MILYILVQNLRSTIPTTLGHAKVTDLEFSCFKVFRTSLFFYLIYKREFMRAILSGNGSCTVSEKDDNNRFNVFGNSHSKILQNLYDE